MSKKIYVEEQDNFKTLGCIGGVIIFVIICVIAGFLSKITGISSNIVFIILFVLVIIWGINMIVNRTGRALKKYKKNNPELVDIINKKTVSLKVFLDEKNKIMYLFADDKKGIIIPVPFADFVEYQIYYDIADIISKHDTVEIKTSLNDPNLSIIKLECVGKNVAETEKLLTYFITQWNKGTYNN